MESKKALPTLLLLLSYFVASSQPDSVRRFVDSALNLMQQHSMYASKLNWKQIRDNAGKRSAGATNYAETADALRYAFKQLGDKHGWLVVDDKEFRNTALQPADNRISQNLADAARKGPHIYCGIVDQSYAYLSMPFFGGQDTVSMNNFAQRLQDSLCSVIRPGTKGVILDLRLNGGGNSFPMVVGVNNLLGTQPKRKDGKPFTGDWDVRNNEIRLSETFYIRLKRDCGDLSHLPVAVLVGPATGSSGEFLAIGFSTRPKTTLVGESTAGFTTGNQGYLLPGVNNGIVLAESVAIDRNGKRHPNGVNPSIVVRGDDFFHHDSDPKVQAALRWLKKQK